jgi:hypothetical protein
LRFALAGPFLLVERFLHLFAHGLDFCGADLGIALLAGQHGLRLLLTQGVQGRIGGTIIWRHGSRNRNRGGS